MIELFKRNYEIFDLGIIDFVKSVSGSQNQFFWLINIVDLMVNDPKRFSDDDFNKIMEEDDTIFSKHQNLLNIYAINLLETIDDLPQSVELIQSLMKLVTETSPAIIRLKLILKNISE